MKKDTEIWGSLGLMNIRTSANECINCFNILKPRSYEHHFMFTNQPLL